MICEAARGNEKNPKDAYEKLPSPGAVGTFSQKPRIDHPQSIIKVSLMKVELVTNLKRRATRIIKELNRDNEPVLITQHGKPAAYLVDVESFENTMRRTQLLEGLARGEAAIQAGRVVFHREAEKRMSRWLK